MVEMGRLKIKEGGEWRYVGSGPATPVLSVFLPAGSAAPSTTSPCGVAVRTIQATNQVVMDVLPFAASPDQFAEWAFDMPTNWDGGAITAQCYFTIPSGTLTLNSTVIFQIAGLAFGDGETMNGTMGTAQSAIYTLSNTTHLTDMLFTNETSLIDIGGTPAGGKYVVIRVNRDAHGTFTGIAHLIAVKIFYTTTGWSE